MKPAELTKHIAGILGDALLESTRAHDALTCEVRADRIVQVCEKLRDDKHTQFTTLIDLCGVDYSAFGIDAASELRDQPPPVEPRFAVVYHLLSIRHNLRLRLRARLTEAALAIDSVTGVWATADWYEREAFDLFGIIFNGHPDLRRLLTDYGFIGHPFRKDFPLSGEVEMRYDATVGRVIYEPVTIEPRTLVPRTIGKPATGE